jgi:hypothetical protein
MILVNKTADVNKKDVKGGGNAVKGGKAKKSSKFANVIMANKLMSKKASTETTTETSKSPKTSTSIFDGELLLDEEVEERF